MKILRNFSTSNGSIFKKLWGLKVEIISYNKKNASPFSFWGKQYSSGLQTAEKPWFLLFGWFVWYAWHLNYCKLIVWEANLAMHVSRCTLDARETKKCRLWWCTYIVLFVRINACETAKSWRRTAWLNGRMAERILTMKLMIDFGNDRKSRMIATRI